jgi:hypothetical protein
MATNQVGVSDVAIEKISIESSHGSIDVRGVLTELNIYEDIFSNALTADLTLSEAYNLPYKLPIIGEEILDIDIKLEGTQGIKFGTTLSPPKFFLYDLNNRYHHVKDDGSGAAKAQSYTTHYISEQGMSNVHSRVSKSYQKYTAAEIVEDIFNNYLYDGYHDLYVSPSHGLLPCIIPNWTPHQACNWLAARARSKEYDTAVNYLFYETMDSINFANLGDLADTGRDEPVLTFTQEPRAQDPTGIEGFAGTGSKGQVRMDEFQFINHFDRIKNAKRGQYASKLVTHDIVTKKIEQHDFNGMHDWASYVHTADFPATPFSDVDIASAMMDRTSLAPSDYKVIGGTSLQTFTDSAVSFYPKHSQMFAQTPEHKYDNEAELWKQKRASQMSLYDGYTLQIQCSGLPMLRVGHIVEVLIASTESTSHGKLDKISDKFLSGNYMVTAIRHIITKDGYRMNVEVSRDGLGEMPEGRMNPNAIQDNQDNSTGTGADL